MKASLGSEGSGQNPPVSTDAWAKLQDLKYQDPGIVGPYAPVLQQVNGISRNFFVGNLADRRRMDKSGLIKDLANISISQLRKEVKLAMEDCSDMMQEIHGDIETTEKEVVVSSKIGRQLKHSCYSYNCLQNNQEVFERVLRYLNIVDLVRHASNRARIYPSGSTKPRPRDISFGDYYTISKKKTKNGRQVVEIFSPTAPPIGNRWRRMPHSRCNFIK